MREQWNGSDNREGGQWSAAWRVRQQPHEVRAVEGARTVKWRRQSHEVRAVECGLASATATARSAPMCEQWNGDSKSRGVQAMPCGRADIASTPAITRAMECSQRGYEVDRTK